MPRYNTSEQRFEQQTQNASERMSLAQESRLLDKARLVFEVTKTRQSIENKRDELINAASIIDKMGSLNVNSPTYERDRAQILSNHTPGLNMAESFIKRQDSLWGAQSKAKGAAAAANQKAFYEGIAKNYGLTSADLNSVAALPGGAVKYIDSTGNPVSAEVARGNESKLQAQFPVGPDVVTMPLSAFQATMRLHNQYSASLPTESRAPTGTTAAVQNLATAPAATAALNAQPAAQPAAPAPATLAATIATNDATAFLRSIGVGSPASTARPTAQPVQAAVSGLPHSANEAVTPSLDENAEESDTSGE
jgi:hypothetical protein